MLKLFVILIIAFISAMLLNSSFSVFGDEYYNSTPTTASCVQEGNPVGCTFECIGVIADMQTSDDCDAIVSVGPIDDSYMEMGFGGLGVPNDAQITGGNITFEYADSKPKPFFTNQTLYCYNGTDWLLTAYPPIETTDYVATYELNTSCYTPVSRANDIQVRFGAVYSDTSAAINFDYVSANISIVEKKEVNITIFNSTGEKTGSAIRIYNSTDDLVVSGSDEVVINLTVYQNYTLELSEEVDGGNLTLRIVNLNITGDLNITSQTIEDYIKSLPNGYNKITPVIALNDTDLSYSHATVYIPKESFTITKILHCKDAWNFTEGSCESVGNWEVNDTADYNAESNSTHIFFNVTRFEGYGGGGSVYLEVNLTLPPGDTLVERYAVFDVNATVYCRGGECSDVYGTVRYNLSSPNPDIAVNITYGDEPFFVNESSPEARKACPTNVLQEGEFCNITWKVNTTGDLDSVWKLGVLFNSTDTDIENNNTGNVTLTIAPCLEEMTIQFSNISFGNVFPNTNGNAAVENSDNLYNITNSGTCTSNIWLKSTNLVKGTDTILYNNITFNNVTNDYSSSYRIGNSFSSDNSTFKRDVVGSTNATGYYFIDVPIIYAGNYEGNMTFCLNSSLLGALC